MRKIRIINDTMELSDVKDKWSFDEKYGAWCLEDVIYTPAPTTPAFQRLSIFVPKAYMSAPGVIDYDGEMNGYTAKTVPVVFENNSAGYMQMPHTWLGGPRNYAEQYLKRGMIYVTCGSRGHEEVAGKSPATIVDLKTAIRFLRHNKANLPGDFEHIISVGWSAGGAMSTLLGVTGNSPDYKPYLAQNGAFMDERDDVFAAQIYCPIIDLDHASAAYEWCFGADHESEANREGPGGVMNEYQIALSKELKARYKAYFESIGIKNPNGEGTMTIDDAYDYLMATLNRSATKYLTKLAAGELDAHYTPEQYISGDYTYMKRAPFGRRPENHHAGEEVHLPKHQPEQHMSLGEMMLRPEPGEGPHGPMGPGGNNMIEAQGTDKSAWLTWDGEKATISDLDTYVLNHRRRMKATPAFDNLELKTPENSLFGCAESFAMHFDTMVRDAVEALKDAYPEEYARYAGSFAPLASDEELKRRIYLINPMNYIRRLDSTLAEHFRIRVGASDADTSFSISMTLALMLMGEGRDTNYELVWDQPHSEADYPGEVTDWIDSLVK